MTYAFDTLKFTQRLEQVGVEREQAVAHAERARDMILADMATKADLIALETAVRSETRSEVTSVRTEVASFRKEVESSLRELEIRMTVKLGAIITAAVAVIAALQKFL